MDNVMKAISRTCSNQISLLADIDSRPAGVTSLICRFGPSFLSLCSVALIRDNLPLQSLTINLKSSQNAANPLLSRAERILVINHVSAGDTTNRAGRDELNLVVGVILLLSRDSLDGLRWSR